LYEEKRAVLPAQIIKDLDNIRSNAQLYPPFFPEFSYAMNDAYLKSQGVSEGAQSYNELLNLALAFEAENIETENESEK